MNSYTKNFIANAFGLSNKYLCCDEFEMYSYGKEKSRDHEVNDHAVVFGFFHKYLSKLRA